MTRRWFAEQFDERMKNEANARSEALRKVTALCSERSDELNAELGLTQAQADELAIIRLKEIIYDL